MYPSTRDVFETGLLARVPESTDQSVPLRWAALLRKTTKKRTRTKIQRVQGARVALLRVLPATSAPPHLLRVLPATSAPPHLLRILPAKSVPSQLLGPASLRRAWLGDRTSGKSTHQQSLESKRQSYGNCCWKASAAPDEPKSDEPTWNLEFLQGPGWGTRRVLFWRVRGESFIRGSGECVPTNLE